jgi:hypothetical protein
MVKTYFGKTVKMHATILDFVSQHPVSVNYFKTTDLHQNMFSVGLSTNSYSALANAF